MRLLRPIPVKEALPCAARSDPSITNTPPRAAKPQRSSRVLTRFLSASSVSGENRLKNGAMNLGAAQVNPKVQTSQISQTHSHHQTPARCMRVSVASNRGPQSNAPRSNCLARSNAYSRGETRLKPKRASILKVLHNEKGSPTSCSSKNKEA